MYGEPVPRERPGVSIPDRDLGYLKPEKLGQQDAPAAEALVSIPDRDLGYLKPGVNLALLFQTLRFNP